MFGSNRIARNAAWLAGLLGIALVAGCATANVGTGGADGLTFATGDIAPLSVSVVAQSGGGVEVQLATRGPQLMTGVLVFTDGTHEDSQLTGTTATLASSVNKPLACVMVQLKKGDYWYLDRDYWYFDSTGHMMPPAVGQTWYSEPAAAL